MALQIQFTKTNTGLSTPQAYARITAVNHNYVTNSVGITVMVYVNQQTRDQNKLPIDQMVFRAEAKDGLSLEATRAEIYSWLKLRPEFLDSVDV